eukprot:c11135_g1_i1.p1 GENE.c11135_g1_i1~~c11135_g1_i1.p1  ORF type:complete len:247 (+),score=62.54 c11135_g1_i1:369-1109(+)
MIFPNDAKWERVPQCTTGRVFLLDFGEGARHFLWLQEPNASRDDDIFDRVKQLVSPVDESADVPASLGGPFTPEPSRVSVPEAPRRLNNNNNNNSAAHPPIVSQADLMRALGALGVPPPNDVSLTAVLQAERVIPLVRDLLQDQQVTRKLFPHLPESQTSEEAVEELLRSAQFQQTLKMLTAALRHGHAATILASMGLDPQQAGPQGGVIALLNAIQAEADKDKETEFKPMDVDHGHDDDDLYGEE